MKSAEGIPDEKLVEIADWSLARAYPVKIVKINIFHFESHSRILPRNASKEAARLEVEKGTSRADVDAMVATCHCLKESGSFAS